MNGNTDTAPPEPIEPQHGLWHGAIATLLYPARGKAPLFLLVTALCLTVKPVVDGLLGASLARAWRGPLLAVAGVAGLAALVLLPSYWSAIVKRSAAGENAPPGWPGMSDPAVLAGTALKAYAVLIWPFLPLLFYLLALENGTAGPSMPLVLTLYLLACLYLPMALLLLITQDKLWQCFLPSNVIEPVIRTFPSYWRQWLLALATGLCLSVSAMLSRIPVIGPFAAAFCGLWLCAIAMRALGRFYRTEKDKLNRA